MQNQQSNWFTVHGPAIMAAILGLIAIITTFLGFANQNALAWISHTSQVQRSLSTLSSSLVEELQAETLFLVSGSDDLLKVVVRTQKATLDQLRVSTESVSDNANQNQNFIELKALIEKRFQTSQALINARRNDFKGGATLIVVSRAQTELEHVHQQIRNIEEKESSLFDSRTSTAASAFRALVIAIVIGVLAVATTLLIWWRETRFAIGVLALSNSKLSESVAERKKSDDQIRHMQKMDAIGQLTGGIAHDFNNMLAIVIGSLSLAQKRLAKGPANVDALIIGALDGANRAASLTKRLLAFSRQQPLAPDTLNLNGIVGGMSEMVRRTLGDGVKVETVLSGGLWPVTVDVSQMENALLNLCVNARDAMPEGGSLTIETSNAHLDEAYVRSNAGVTPGQYVLIAVTDTGSGMTPDVLASAFDPFFTTKEVGKGSGLGLSQVFGFVKQSGGHLKIYSEVGLGTTMKIYLPRSFETASAGRAASEMISNEARSMHRGNESQIILVVEDEAEVRSLTVMTLRELGYTVFHADDAEMALKQLDVHPTIGLLFTDIVMPGMNGRKLADEALRRNPTIKVLYTTGFTRNAVVHGGVLDRGVNFIAKPFTIEQLAAKVGDVMPC